MWFYVDTKERPFFKTSSSMSLIIKSVFTFPKKEFIAKVIFRKNSLHDILSRSQTHFEKLEPLQEPRSWKSFLFFQLCQDNRDLRLERSAKGDLIIMPPTGGETSNSNAGITAQLWLWNNLHKLGVVFDSSTGFKLPNGADRSPDAAWIPSGLDRSHWPSILAYKVYMNYSLKTQ